MSDDRSFSVRVANYVGETGTYTGTVHGAHDTADAQKIVNRELTNSGHTLLGEVKVEDKNR